MIKRVVLYGFVLWVASAVHAGPRSADGRFDVEELLRAAESSFELERQDAVILAEVHEHNLLEAGRLSRSVFRLVFIRTAMGLRQYADLRVPHDSQAQKLHVKVLRTWRDQQWWESGETAVVETTPFAVDRAYDYTTLRETMLLHDGIELPCVLECHYLVEDVTPFRLMDHGAFVFAQNDPALHVEFSVSAPQDVALTYQTSSVMNEPVHGRDGDTGNVRMTWTAERVDALKTPHAADAFAEDPYVMWSRQDWPSLERALENAFRDKMLMDDPLRVASETALKRVTMQRLKADRVAEFVSDSVRWVHYDGEMMWPLARPASQIHASGYGHELDRAILAATLFESAGIQVFPAMAAAQVGELSTEVAQLDRWPRVGLWLNGESWNGFFDPRSCKVSDALTSLRGRSCWRLGLDERPALSFAGDGFEHWQLCFTYMPENETWNVGAALHARGVLNPMDAMQGDGGKAREAVTDWLSRLCAAPRDLVWNPRILKPDELLITASYQLPLGEPDGFGRQSIAFTMSDPLPDQHLSLSLEERQTSVWVSADREVKIDVSVDLGTLSLVYVPAGREIRSDVGTYRCLVDRDEGTVRWVSELHLNQGKIPKEKWGELRQLLLAAMEPVNCMMLFR